MLGTDRPSVSLAAGVLQRKKLIEYTRGAVKIVNRKKLEDSACECYGVIRQYDGELGLKYREVKTRPVFTDRVENVVVDKRLSQAILLTEYHVFITANRF